MTQLILIRHGQTEWNKEERFRGRADLDLTDVGRKQAHLAAERVARWPIKEVYSSPLRRATATAHILAQKLEVPLTPVEELTDIDFGTWQGLLLEEAKAHYPTTYSLWRTNPHLVRFPRGEDLAQVQLRAVSAVEKLITTNSAEAIVVVSHKVVCQLLILRFLSLECFHFWQIAQDVCAINIFERQDDLMVAVLLNDICHLENMIG